MEYDYWDERFLLLNEMLLQQGEEYAQNATKAYMLAMLEIEKDINNFYARFANENTMTYQQAKQLLTSEQRQAFQMELEEYIAYGQQNGLDDVWIKKLENASTVHRITRLQAIQYQLQQQVEKLEAQKIKGITETLKNIYKEGYYRTAYEIQKGTGVGSAFSKIDENKIDKVLARAWAPDGKNFSERVWGTDRTQLIYQLQTRFTQGIIRGEGSQKIIKDMSKALYSSRKATERLVLTESAFVASASRKDTYENLGVKQYKVLATLDIKTSEMCRKLDGKVFDLKDYKIGLTANPFHPRCRSTTVPNIDSKYIQNQQRAARNKEGKTYYVPSDMTYEQWHKTYVEADPEWLLQEKKHKNKSADKKQYEEYKSALGKKAVGSFDDFQEVKYNNKEEWDTLKGKIRELDNKPYNIRINESATEQEVQKEIKIVKETLAEMPKKVKRMLKNGTIIDIGQEGNSQYNPYTDTMYIAKGGNKKQVRHETGHVIEKKMMNVKKVESLKREILGEIDFDDFYYDIYENNNHEEFELLFINNDNLISLYQGRVYCKSQLVAYDDSGEFRYDRLLEFISEPYELYMRDKTKLQNKCPKLYEYIKEVVE